MAATDTTREFQQIGGQILLMDGAERLELTLAEFQQFEPTYDAAQIAFRVWRSDGERIRGDGRMQTTDAEFNAQPYIAKMAKYRRQLAARRYHAPADNPNLLDAAYFTRRIEPEELR